MERFDAHLSNFVKGAALGASGYGVTAGSLWVVDKFEKGTLDEAVSNVLGGEGSWTEFVFNPLHGGVAGHTAMKVTSGIKGLWNKITSWF